ncbi:MAG: glycosyltransferase family 39 protein [Patescibacteria group bacterium]
MIFLILVLGLVLRLISLDQSFWLDEATSGIVVRNFSFWEIISKFSPGDFHPPLYYLLLKFWSLVFGTSEIGLRLFSVLAGILTIWMVFKIAKELNPSTSLRMVSQSNHWKFPELAAILLATSGLHLYYSQEARMYSLATFFVSLSFFLFVKTLEKSRVGNWIAFSIFLTASFFTHYLTILMLPVYWLIGIFAKKDRNWWKKFIGSHIILVVLFIVWFPIFSTQFSAGISVSGSSPIWWQTLGKTSLKEILLVPTKFILGRISLDNKPLYAAVVIVVLAGYGFVFFRSIRLIRSIRYLYILWLWLFIPTILAVLLGLWLSVFSYFRLLFVLPAFYLILALAISWLPRKIFIPALIFVIGVNLVSSLAYLTNSKFQREDWRGLVQFIEGDPLREKSIVVFPAKSQMEAYRYYKKEANIAGPDETPEKYAIIWLMRYAQAISDPRDMTRIKIEDLGFKKISEQDFNAVVVWKYQK